MTASDPHPETLGSLLAEIAANPAAFRASLDASPAALIAFDANRRIEHANAAATALFGYGAGELDGLPTDRIVPPRMRQPDAPPMLASPEIIEVDLPGLRKDGSELLVEWRFASVKRAQGPLFVMQVRDRSAIDRVNAQMRASEERFRLLVDGVRDYAIFLLDAAGKISSWNAGAARIKGWNEEEILGQDYGIFFTPEDVLAGKPRRNLDAALASGKYEEYGWRRRKDGSRFWAHAQITALRDPSGELQGFAKLTRDLTGQLRAEENERALMTERLRREAAQAAEQRIRKSEEQLSRLQRMSAALSRAATTQAVSEAILSEGLAAVGAAAGGIYSLEPEAQLLRVLAERGHPPDVVDTVREVPLDSGAPVAECARRKTPMFFESMEAFAARFPDFQAFIAAGAFEASVAMPLLTHGALLGVIGFRFRERRAFDDSIRAVLNTVSEQCAQALDRARLLEAERISNARLAGLQRVTAEMSRARTAHEVAVAAIESGSQALGAKMSSVYLLGEKLRLLVERGFWPEFQETYREIDVESDRPLAIAARGRSVWVENAGEREQRFPGIAARYARDPTWMTAYACLPLRIGEQVLGVLSYAFAAEHRFDREERIFLETLADNCAQSLDRARLLDTARAEAARAAEASRVKDEFLAVAGHELRNPLAPIFTAVDLMKLRPGESHEGARNIIERQARHLKRLVDDLLDISRITAGRVALDRARVNLGEVVARAVELAHPLMEESRHSLSVDIPRDLHVDADPVRLAQVLSNLLANAAKYTPPGGTIAVRARREAKQVTIAVTDNGSGIPPDLLPRVFDLFVQGKQSIERSRGGLGLGLAIVRSLVELHGGQVEARSAGEDRGSEFTIRLPVSADAALPAAEPSRAAAQVSRPHGARVLVVDDNTDAAELLAEALETMGYSTAVAHDGPSALEVASRFQPGVALLDLGLPVMDGFELARRLRQTDGLSELKLIAITGYGQTSDRARTHAAGFQEHLVKPVELHQIETILAGVLARA